MTHSRFAPLAEQTMSDFVDDHEQPQLMSGFVAIPLVLLQSQSINMLVWQCQLYQWAYAQAQAVLAPSWLERDVLAVWN